MSLPLPHAVFITTAVTFTFCLANRKGSRAWRGSSRAHAKQALCRICGWAKGCARPMTSAMPKVMATQSHRLSTATTWGVQRNAMDANIEVFEQWCGKRSGKNWIHYSAGMLVQDSAHGSSIDAPRRNSPRHLDQGCCSHLGANLHPDVFAFGLRDASPGVEWGTCRLSERTQTGFRQSPAYCILLFHWHMSNSFACPKRPPQKEPLKCSGVAYLQNSCLAPCMTPQTTKHLWPTVWNYEMIIHSTTNHTEELHFSLFSRTHERRGSMRRPWKDLHPSKESLTKHKPTCCGKQPTTWVCPKTGCSMALLCLFEGYSTRRFHIRVTICFLLRNASFHQHLRHHVPKNNTSASSKSVPKMRLST